MGRSRRLPNVTLAVVKSLGAVAVLLMSRLTVGEAASLGGRSAEVAPRSGVHQPPKGESRARTSRAGSTPAPDESVSLAQAPRGALVIVGGGPIPDAINRRFLALAGGAERARIVIIPNAAANTDDAGNARVEVFGKLGATAVILDLTRVSATSDSAARLLGSATGIWFPGGLQSRLAAAVVGTPVLDSIKSRYRAGAAVGGTSAGAAVMSDPMIVGDERRPGGARPLPDSTAEAWMTIDRDDVVMAPGFGLLPDVTVDQHFLRRRRHNRLISVALERAPHLAVGIDESTALVVLPGGRWEVLGESQVVVYDARRATVTPKGESLGAVGVSFHVLSSGATWTPKGGVPALPRR